MAITPKIKIINKLKTLIPLMTIANGYSRNYGTVDQDTPASINYPAVWLEFPEDEPIDEDIEVIERDTVNLLTMFRVRINTASDLDEEMGDINADFSKMFADNLGALQIEGMIDYRYAGENTGYNLIAAHPADIVIAYNLSYRWQQKYPYQT